MRPTGSEPGQRGRAVWHALHLSWMLALCLSASVAWSATAISMDVPALTRASDQVVHGQVLRTHPHWSPRTGRILTEVELSVVESLKGPMEPRIVNVLLPGGTVGDVHQRISGAPRLEPGEEVIAFLRRGAGGPRIVGLSQGIFRVVRPDNGGGARAMAVLSEDLRLLDPVSLQPVPSVSRTMGLQLLRAQVLAADGGTASAASSSSRTLRALDTTPPPYVRSRVPSTSPEGGRCLWWPGGSTITFQQQQCMASEPNCAARQQAVQLALRSWDDVLTSCASLRLVDGPATASWRVGYELNGPNENLIAVRGRGCSQQGETDCWEHGAETAGLTTATFSVSTGQILDADIELNGVYLYSLEDPDFQGTMTHELGHALGLDHSPDARSTMYASNPPGHPSLRLIDEGSRQAMCTAYPAGQPAFDCVGSAEPVKPAPGDAASGCSAAAGSAGPVIFGLLMLRVLRRRSRRAQRG
jgi:Matrixin